MLGGGSLVDAIRRGRPSNGVFLIETHSFRPGYKHPWKRTDGEIEPMMSPVWQKA